MTSQLRSPDFEVVREPWNKYELMDGSIIKSKFVLKKIDSYVDNNKGKFNIDGENIVVVYADPSLKGSPDKRIYPPAELKKSVVKDDMRYSILFEEWNEYLMDDATRIRLKTTVTKVSRTDKHDKSGDPIYLVDNNAMMNIKKPPQFNKPE